MSATEIKRYGHIAAICFTTVMPCNPSIDDMIDKAHGHSIQYSKPCIAMTV